MNSYRAVWGNKSLHLFLSFQVLQLTEATEVTRCATTNRRQNFKSCTGNTTMEIRWSEVPIRQSKSALLQVNPIHLNGLVKFACNSKRFPSLDNNNRIIITVYLYKCLEPAWFTWICVASVIQTVLCQERRQQQDVVLMPQNLLTGWMAQQKQNWSHKGNVTQFLQK